MSTDPAALFTMATMTLRSTTRTATSLATHSPTSTSTSTTAPTSSPLLFFVALGFGVVFTNLWIIVGVKYCFRYNSRNRQLREAAENGEPIDLANINGRPHRRRREKKLMSMEEVNERFPLTKYKIWRATREQEGLPAAGGVTAPSSRAPSIKNSKEISRVVQPDNVNEKAAVPSTPVSPIGESKDFATPATPLQNESDSAPSSSVKGESIDSDHHLEPLNEFYNVKLNHITPANPATASTSATAEDAEEDEDPIRTAVPAELLAHPGDACAICIDNLDDDDEVRGLTCGHAFHAGCLDPWLTSRRACCPLCKADYYVPKPRPEGEQAADANADRQPAVPEPPMAIWLGARGGVPFRSRSAVLVRPLAFDTLDHFAFPSRPRGDRRRARSNTQTTEETTAASAITPSWRTRARTPFHHAHTPGTFPTIAIPSFLRRNTNTPNTASAEAGAAESNTTPSQLEAGQR